MANTPKLNLLELIYDNTKKVKDFFMNEIVGKINSNNQKIDTAISEKITQVALKSELPLSPTTFDNLYIVYEDEGENNGQYRWTGSAYEKVSSSLPENIVLYDDEELGESIGVNADTLGGQLPSYYAKQIDTRLETEEKDLA